MSERVTWEECPQCRRLAAVAWLDGVPVGFDCPNGCHLSRSRMTSVFASWPEAGLRRPVRDRA
jgi:hypothetical protein